MAKMADASTRAPEWWTGDWTSDILSSGVITTADNITIGSYPIAHTYVPPEEFQQQVVELIKLLHAYGPKLRVLADVLGAMKIEEEDNAK